MSGEQPTRGSIDTITTKMTVILDLNWWARILLVVFGLGVD
jgi:hypothetical protein